MDFNDLAYGTNEHRRATKHPQQQDELVHGVVEISKAAVGGMITMGVIGALGSAFHKD
jgi:hypothetical protein